jgi:hypothetical protein
LGHAPPENLKTRCLRLAKNAFAIQHLLHHSIIYTFIHYPTNFVLLRWTCISEVIPAIQVAFFLLVRVFPLNLSFYLNFYNYIFLSWGNIFWVFPPLILSSYLDMKGKCIIMLSLCILCLAKYIFKLNTSCEVCIYIGKTCMQCSS